MDIPRVTTVIQAKLQPRSCHLLQYIHTKPLAISPSSSKQLVLLHKRIEKGVQS